MRLTNVYYFSVYTHPVFKFKVQLLFTFQSYILSFVRNEKINHTNTGLTSKSYQSMRQVINLIVKHTCTKVFYTLTAF